MPTTVEVDEWLDVYRCWLGNARSEKDRDAIRRRIDDLLDQRQVAER